MSRHGRRSGRRSREIGKLLIALMLLAVVALVRGKPAFSTVYVDDRAQNYLMKFGYLPQSGLETGNLRTDDQLRDAIRSLQKFGGIPETGQVDERTQQLMVRRRCGLPDKPDLRLQDPSLLRRFKRYTLHGTPWKHHNLTWSLRTERPSGLETGGVRRELARALDLWAKNSKLTFHEINSDAADILIYFHRGYHGDGYPFDGRGQILAHAFFPGSDRGGDAHFDEEEEWTLDSSGNDDGTSLFAVAAHEFGHSLGLAHSSVRGALMYPWYQGITEDYELPEDDKHGIQQMYGAPESRLWGKNPDYPGYRPVHRPSYPTYTPRTTSTTTTTTTTTSTTTTERPWRTRPRDPMSHPPDRRDRPYRPNHYPEERTRPPYYPPRPEWPVTPRRPHRHHTPPTVGTTGTPYTTTRTTQSTRYRPPVKKDLPDKCDTDYDAISLIRRELFIFKGKYVWRLNDRGLVDGFPAEINQLFKFPMRVDHVDAVYERVEDNRIIFFVGRYFYVFKAFYLEPGYPKPLTALGLPPDLEKIDAAMVWGYNKKTYFFSGSMYWRFDENVNHVELDYPRDISMFAGVGPNIDTVFQWKNGTTYFFKGKHFWQFDDMRMRVAHKKPKSSAHFWMGCPRGIETNDVNFDDVPTKARINSISASAASTPGGFVLIALVLMAVPMSQSSRSWYT